MAVEIATAYVNIVPYARGFGRQLSAAMGYELTEASKLAGVGASEGFGSTFISGIGSVAAFYLASHTDFGWIFGAGMLALAVAWITTTGLAVTAICRCLVQQHREWMIRSYVMTFAFVIFRVVQPLLQNVGTITEQLAAAGWLCWTIPLLTTELVLQGRKKVVAVSPWESL